MNIFWIGCLIFAFVILLAVFVPEIWTKMHYKKLDKERAERKKQVNDKLAELFPLALAEMKKKWKDITDDNVKTDAYGTRCSFYYRGFLFYLFVNDYELVEIHRDCDNVGTIPIDTMEFYVKTFARLFYDVDGIIERLERVMKKLAQKIMDLHGGGCEWKLVKDITRNNELMKVLEKDGNRLTLSVCEKYVLARVEKDQKVWATYCAKEDEATDLFDAINKVFGKVVQWEDFM